MPEWDGSPAMFAPEGDGCLQRAKREDAGRFSKEGKSLDDFWYFSSVKSTIKEKYLYISSRETTGLPYELKSKSRQQPKKFSKHFCGCRGTAAYNKDNAPHNPNRRKKQSDDCSPLCFWKEKLLFSASKNDSLILGIRVKFLECYADLNLRAVLLINRCRGYAAA